jgi:ParB/RepB/Spo0J family partition protein
MTDALLTPTLPAEGVLVALPWGLVHDSPFQYRKTYNESALDDLANNIRETGGIHTPILARRRFAGPMFPDYNPGDGVEIVAGHRRKLAGMRAGLGAAPLLVKDLTEEQARKIQLTENIQREDVHAIEEAEGFQELIDHHNETADTIAAMIGKSRSYVYGRLKLLALCGDVRQACLAGEIGAETALLVARVGGTKLQQKALGYIRGKYIDMKDGGAKSYRQIRDLLNERFTLDLKTALFDPEDEMLLPTAGNCVTCPKRSGNAPEFEDVATEDKRQRGYYSRVNLGPDVCTDTDCFDAKKKAHLKREAAKLTENGKFVVDGAKARAAIGADGKVKGAYIALKDVKDQVAKARTAAQRDSTIAPPLIVTIQNPRTGATVEAVRTADLVAAGVRKKDQPKAATSAGSSRDYAAERRDREARGQAITEQRLAVLRAVHSAALVADRSPDEHRILLDYLIEQNQYGDGGLLLVAKLWGHEQEDPFIEAVKAMPLAHQALVMVEIAMTLNLEDNGWGNSEPMFLRSAAKLYGIDPDAPIEALTPTPSTAARAPEEAAAKGQAGVKYRNAETGETWSGRGLKPAWLKAAIASGKSLSDFELPTPTPAARAPEAAAGGTKDKKRSQTAAPAEPDADEEQKDDAGCAGGLTHSGSDLVDAEVPA